MIKKTQKQNKKHDVNKIQVLKVDGKHASQSEYVIGTTICPPPQKKKKQSEFRYQ